LGESIVDLFLGSAEYPFDILQGTAGIEVWDFNNPTSQQAILLASAQDSSYPDLVILLEGDDQLIDSGEARILSGNQGNDRLDGGDGADTLFGGKDNDVLTGGAGNDHLSGDLGDDTLTGGTGQDHFDFGQATSTANTDIVTDFTDGEDHIDLPDGLSFADLMIAQDGANVRITASDANSEYRNVALILQNTSVVAIDASDFMSETTENGGSSSGATDTTTSVKLDPSQGKEIGFAYEAFLSPQQEPGEEEETPPFTPAVFQSTEPSTPRDERTSRGHGIVRFTKDLSEAYVDVDIDNVNIDDISMFHIHCGRPDQLGPILVNFALIGDGDIQGNFRDDDRFSVKVTNQDIVNTTAAGEGIVGAFTAGCPIIPGTPDKIKTVAGMHTVAQQSELYFNLHTTSQTFFGDIRGKLTEIDVSELESV
jgi:hypothetical protein